MTKESNGLEEIIGKLPTPLTERRFHCIPCNQDFYFDDYIKHRDIHRGETD